MEMMPVSSSAISHIGYNKDTKQMKITFKKSGTYDYCGVPKDVFDAFFNASSIGIYHAKHIRDKYVCS
jgi:hypothetical protein